MYTLTTNKVICTYLEKLATTLSFKFYFFAIRPRRQHADTNNFMAFCNLKNLQNDLGCFDIDCQSKPFIDHPSSYI
jgi:hypothetical protein